jgi:hypothetical protein
MKTFDHELLLATSSAPSATRLAARAALTLWVLIPEALQEAEARRDDAMVSRLTFLSALLNADDA